MTTDTCMKVPYGMPIFEFLQPQLMLWSFCDQLTPIYMLLQREMYLLSAEEIGVSVDCSWINQVFETWCNYNIFVIEPLVFWKRIG